MRTPVEGAAGVGYILRASYDLPPVNFDAEEVEALRVGLLMLARTGDSALQRAALRVRQKITDLNDPIDWLQVAPWGIALDDPAQGCVSIAALRTAIREERKLRLTYRDAQQVETVRVVWPIVIVYHIECVLLVGWCDLRAAFRHFRTDRIYGCQLLEAAFVGQSKTLRTLWSQQNRWDEIS
jgi:predicted DNA-binding transcriptional regulator YafY